MGQFVHNGIIYEEMPNGQAKVVGPAPGAQQSAFGPAIGGNPLIPGQVSAQALEARHTQGEIAQQPYKLDAQKAETALAQLNLRNAQEQYAAQHPQANDSGLYGNDFLKTVSPSDQSMIKALSEGRLAFPQGAALRAPFWQEKLSQVAQFDPTFDATNFNARAKGRAAAISGKLGASNNALNTAMGHLGTLESQIGGTASHNFTPFNAVENTVAKTFGDPGVTNFQDTANKLADELESVYRNGGGAESGVVRQLRGLDVNASKAQKDGVIKNAMDLLASKQAANLAQYNFGTGGKPTWTMLDQHTQDVLNSPTFSDIRDKYFAPPAAAAPPPPPPPPPGTSGDISPVAPGSGYKTVPDPRGSAMIDSMVRSGVPYPQAVQQFTQAFPNDGPFGPGEYNAAAAYHAKHPSYAGSLGGATANVPLALKDQITNAVAQSGTGAFLGNFANQTALGLPKLAAGRDQTALFDASADQNHGTAAMLGNIGGTITGAALTGGAVSKAAPFLGAYGDIIGGNASRAALTGDTIYGGVSGAAQNPDNPVEGGAEGMAAMLAGHGAGRLVLGPAAAKALDSKAGQALVNGGLKLKGMFGGNSATFSPPTSLDSGQKLLMGQAGDNLGDIRTNLQDAQNLGLPYGLADASPKLRMLAGSAVRKSPDVRALTESTIAPRQLGQAERAIGQIGSNLAPVGDVSTMQGDLLKAAQTQSSPLYATAKAQPVPELTAHPKLKEVLDRPAGQAAIKSGFEAALNKGEDVGTLNYGTDPSGNTVAYGNPSWNVIHYARQALDASGNTDVRHALDSQIAKINPGFKTADAAYSGVMKGSDALQAGVSATDIKMTPEATQRAMAGYPDNASHFQQGYASNMADQIERQRLSGNPYNLVNGSLGQQAKLATVFPQGAANFSRAQGLEGDMSKTAYETLGGSPTAGRLEADSAFASPMADAASELGTMALTHGIPSPKLLARMAMKAGDFRRLGAGAQAKADAIGPTLLGQDPTAALSALDNLSKIDLARRAYMSRLGAGAGQVGTGMFGAPILYAMPQN